MNHMVLSGIIQYDPDIIYVVESKSITVRFQLSVGNISGTVFERHKILLTGSLAEYVRDHVEKNDRVELTGRLKPSGISYHELQNEIIQWRTIRKID